MAKQSRSVICMKDRRQNRPIERADSRFLFQLALSTSFLPPEQYNLAHKLVTLETDPMRLPERAWLEILHTELRTPPWERGVGRAVLELEQPSADNLD